MDGYRGADQQHQLPPQPHDRDTPHQEPEDLISSVVHINLGELKSSARIQGKKMAEGRAELAGAVDAILRQHRLVIEQALAPLEEDTEVRGRCSLRVCMYWTRWFMV